MTDKPAALVPREAMARKPRQKEAT